MPASMEQKGTGELCQVDACRKAFSSGDPSVGGAEDDGGIGDR